MDAWSRRHLRIASTWMPVSASRRTTTSHQSATAPAARALLPPQLPPIRKRPIRLPSATNNFCLHTHKKACKMRGVVCSLQGLDLGTSILISPWTFGLVSCLFSGPGAVLTSAPNCTWRMNMFAWIISSSASQSTPSASLCRAPSTGWASIGMSACGIPFTYLMVMVVQTRHVSFKRIYSNSQWKMGISLTTLIRRLEFCF